MQTSRFVQWILIYNTQVFRVSGGHMTGRCHGLFPPRPILKGKALGTRLFIARSTMSFLSNIGLS